MAECLILQTFKGSQDGRFTKQFNEGEVADLSDYLMACAPKGSFQRLDTPAAPVVENKATVTSKSRTEHIPTLGGKK